MIVCCFKIVTFSNGSGITHNDMQMLMTILGRSLPKGSKLSSLVFYEAIKTFFTNLMDQSRQQLDVGRTGDSAAISAGGELAEGIAAILLPSEDGRFIPTPEQSNTEAVRLARSRALLAYISCGFRDQGHREKASMAVSLWLTSERSGQVRDILREAHDCLENRGRNGN